MVLPRLRQSSAPARALFLHSCSPFICVCVCARTRVCVCVCSPVVIIEEDRKRRRGGEGEGGRPAGAEGSGRRTEERRLYRIPPGQDPATMLSAPRVRLISGKIDGECQYRVCVCARARVCACVTTSLYCVCAFAYVCVRAHFTERQNPEARRMMAFALLSSSIYCRISCMHYRMATPLCISSSTACPHFVRILLAPS